MTNPLTLSHGDVVNFNGYPGVILALGSIRLFVYATDHSATPVVLMPKDASQLDLVCSQAVAALRYAESLPVISDEF